MKISAIVAMASNRVIGNKNTLPRNYPEDLQHFRKMTNWGIIIMGRKTYQSIGRPLPNRRNIVISRSGFSDPKYPDLEVYSSIDQVIDDLQVHFNKLSMTCNIIPTKVGIQKNSMRFPEQVWEWQQQNQQKIRVIGGAGIYQQFLDRGLIDELHLTMIKKSYEWDTTFPNFEDNFHEIQREEREDLDFIVYEKGNNEK